MITSTHFFVVAFVDIWLSDMVALFEFPFGVVGNYVPLCVVVVVVDVDVVVLCVVVPLRVAAVVLVGIIGVHSVVFARGET